MTKEKTVGLEELEKEKKRLEGDRATLGERLQALNVERERVQQQLVMIAGALQTIGHFLEKTDPEEKAEPSMSLEDHGLGPDEEK